MEIRKFIKKTIGFLLPILIVAVGFEILLRQIPNDYKLKRTYLDEHASEIETLILGSSHSFYGINPEYLESNSFNASYLAQTLEFDLEILRKYEDQFQRLKYVILPISYPSLFETLEEKHNWRISYYVIYYNIFSPSVKHYAEVLSKRPDFNYRVIKRYYLEGENGLLSSESGWPDTFYGVEGDFVESGKKAALRHTFDITRNYDTNISILSSIISFCARKNLKLLLFTPPSHETYINKLEPEQLKLAVETANELAKRHSHVSYENYLNDQSFSVSDYYDADHLNEEGSRKLTLRINELINEKMAGISPANLQ